MIKLTLRPFVCLCFVAVFAFVWGDKPITGSFIDTRDGQTYRYIKIGEQIWMGENLNYAANGWPCDCCKGVTGSWCYADNSSNCQTYGRLYTWEAAKSACPTGWRLPTHDEWENLITAVGGRLVAGRALKAIAPDWDGEDAFGFSALPGGYRSTNSVLQFDDIGSSGRWWTATECKNCEKRYISAHRWRMWSGSMRAFERRNEHHRYGLSVRCVKEL